MTIIIIDGNNALFRFGGAMQNLTAPDGTPTGAIHGLLGCLVRFKQRYSDGRFIVVWDGRGYRVNGWRIKLFSGYKQREPSQGYGSVHAQHGLVDSILTKLGVCQISVPEVEADDVIGTLVSLCLESGWTPVVYSGDRDFVQLMIRGAQVITGNNKKDRLAPETEESVRDRYRCSLEQVILVRALSGDSSDRIPGVAAKVGDVTAAKYVVAGIDPRRDRFEDNSSAAQQIAQKLAPHWDLAQRNYRLMRILASPQDDELMPEQRVALTNALSTVKFNIMVGLPKRAPANEILNLLGDLGLQQAIEHRSILLKLNQEH
jgi:5'-3' exonuclease